MWAVFEKVVKISLHRKFDKLTSEHLQLRALQHRLQLVLLGLKHVTWVKAHHPVFQDKTIQGIWTKKELKEKKTKPLNKDVKHLTDLTGCMLKQPSTLICKN